MRLGIVRFQFQRPAAAGDRLIQLPLAFEGNTQVVVSLDVVRLEFQCATVAGDGVLQLPLVHRRIAHVVVHLDEVRLQFQCTAPACDRFVQLPLLPELRWLGCYGKRPHSPSIRSPV